MHELIAVVDDEPDIVELVSLHLHKSGFKVEEFSDSSGLLTFIDQNTPDLIILDIMLPDADGFEICKYLREDDRWASIPVIMLTAKSDETDKIIGLEIGADDYVTKPFSPKELVARVKAVLRRKKPRKQKERFVIRVGDGLEIDIQKYEVMHKGKKVDLTPTEFRILQNLAENKGAVYTRNQILDALWGNEKYVLDRTVDVHIKNLRDKLGEAGSLIKNIRGIGYKLEE